MTVGRSASGVPMGVLHACSYKGCYLCVCKTQKTAFQRALCTYKWARSGTQAPTGPRARTTKRTVLRIVKAAEFTYFYCFTNLLSAMVKKGKQN